MNEIILSNEQSKKVVANWIQSKDKHDNFHSYLNLYFNIIEYEWVYNTDKLRVKTKTPEQLTWFLLNI